MTTTIDEIADRVYRISTYSPDGPPGGITFNQFLVDDEEPMLIHTGMRIHFGQTLAALSTVLPPEQLRWITSNHASRPDELGALDDWFAAAPRAEVVHGEIACWVNLTDVTTRSVRSMVDGDHVELGRHRLRWLATPHVPGPWEAGFWFDENESMLFTGDLFAQSGNAVALTTGDIVGPAVIHDTLVRGTALTPATSSTIRSLGDLEPHALALMHGSTYRGDCTAPLHELADHYEARLCSTLGVDAR
jgi:flavorubredoxin